MNDVGCREGNDDEGHTGSERDPVPRADVNRQRGDVPDGFGPEQNGEPAQCAADDQPSRSWSVTIRGHGGRQDCRPAARSPASAPSIRASKRAEGLHRSRSMPGSETTCPARDCGASPRRTRRNRTKPSAGSTYAPRRPNAAIRGADRTGNNGDCSACPCCSWTRIMGSTHGTVSSPMREGRCRRGASGARSRSSQQSASIQDHR